MTKLSAKTRDKKTKLEAIRADGFVPAVVYGPKQEAISISINDADFLKTYENAGESTIVSLSIDGEEHDVLIHELQRDPVRGNILHVDFYAIERGKKLQVSVELVFEGLSPAEKNFGAMIVKVLHEIEIESLPRNLPSELKVDLTKLEEVGSQIHAKDIPLPEGVELITDPDDVIVLAKEAKEEEIEAPVEAPDMESIEVEKKGKAEETEEENKEK